MEGTDHSSSHPDAFSSIHFTRFCLGSYDDITARISMCSLPLLCFFSKETKLDFKGEVPDSLRCLQSALYFAVNQSCKEEYSLLPHTSTQNPTAGNGPQIKTSLWLLSRHVRLNSHRFLKVLCAKMIVVSKC